MKKKQREISLEQAHDAMSILAKATHERDKVVAQMNLNLTAVRDHFEATIKFLGEVISNETKYLRTWADQNPQLFGKSRSFRLMHGVVGYRLGNYALKTIRGITWARALNLIKAINPRFIRCKAELDKETIISERETITPAELKSMGLCIEQAEAFYANPDTDQITDTK